MIRPESLLSTGAVGFMLGDSIAVDSVIGKLGYTAGFARGTTTAVNAADTRANGLRYTASGILRLYDATAGLPAGSVTLGGFAVSTDGQLCYTTAAPDASSVFLGGVAVTQNGRVHLSDLSPAAWYRFNQGITVTGAGVSTWADKSGNSRDLLQGTDTNRPALQSDGSILFDGVDNFLKTAGFTLNQPTTIYILFKSVTWTADDRVFDGDADNSGALAQFGTTPQLTPYAGGNTIADGNMPVNTYAVCTTVFNGASGFFQVNANTGTTENFGAANMGGVTIGRQGTTAALFGNVQVKEMMICASAHAAAQRSAVRSYLNRVGGL